jgi:KDO2-lipid IV(A) lauroyltransferase
LNYAQLFETLYIDGLFTLHLLRVKNAMKREIKKLKKDVLYFLFLATMEIAGLLSRGIALKIGEITGRLAFHSLRKLRKRTIGNLSMAFNGEKNRQEILELARDVFANLGKNAFEIFVLNKRSPQEINRIVTSKGEERMEEGFKRGRGIIYITAHLGNWELMAAYYALKGFHPVNVIARSIYDERINRILLKFRSRYRVKTILRGRRRKEESIATSTKKILRVLRRNEVLGMLFDQNIRGIDSVPVTFLGMPTRAPSGAASLALASQAEVFFGYTYRGEDNRHHIVVERVDEVIRSEDRNKDILSNTSHFTRLIEERVREFPSQWVWVHDRWGKYRKSEITASAEV